MVLFIFIGILKKVISMLSLIRKQQFIKCNSMEHINGKYEGNKH